MIRHKGRSAGTALGVALWLACLVAPHSSLAKIRCQQNPEGTVLAITVTEESYAGVRRSGEKVGVFDVISGRRGCPSEALVDGVEQIRIFVTTPASAYVELRNGPLAEIEASGPGYVELIGGPAPEHFQFMDEGQKSGVNLNPDEDADLDLVVSRKFRDRMLFVVNGGGGADRIDALRDPALEMFATGGAGNDTPSGPLPAERSSTGNAEPTD